MWKAIRRFFFHDEPHMRMTVPLSKCSFTVTRIEWDKTGPLEIGFEVITLRTSSLKEARQWAKQQSEDYGETYISLEVDNEVWADGKKVEEEK
jgi:hypothetical protein